MPLRSLRHSFDPSSTRALPPHTEIDTTRYLVLMVDCLHVQTPQPRILSKHRSLECKVDRHIDSQIAANSLAKKSLYNYYREIQEKRPDWLPRGDQEEGKEKRVKVLPELKTRLLSNLTCHQRERRELQVDEKEQSLLKKAEKVNNPSGMNKEKKICQRYQIKPMNLRKAEFQFAINRITEQMESKITRLNRQMSTRMKYGKVRASTFDDSSLFYLPMANRY